MSKLYVHCFQDLKIKGQERPYLAEFVEQLGKAPSTARCRIRVGRTEYVVHRQSCSETPFTMNELKAVQIESAPKEKKGRGRPSTESAKPTVKIEGSYW